MLARRQVRMAYQGLPGGEGRQSHAGGTHMVRAAWLDGQVGRGGGDVLGCAAIAIEPDEAVDLLAVLGPGDPRAQPGDDSRDLVARYCGPAFRPRQLPGREPDGMHLDKHLARSWIRGRDQ